MGYEKVMLLKEQENVACIRLAQDRNHWRAVVNTVKDFIKKRKSEAA